MFQTHAEIQRDALANCPVILKVRGLNAAAGRTGSTEIVDFVIAVCTPVHPLRDRAGEGTVPPDEHVPAGIITIDVVDSLLHAKTRLKVMKSGRLSRNAGIELAVSSGDQVQPALKDWRCVLETHGPLNVRRHQR